MSTNRRTLGVDSSPAPKGPNGERLCRNCNGPMPEDKRKHNCSPECSKQWMQKTSPHVMRRAVFDRDQGVCAVCKRDTVAEYRQEFPRIRIHPGWPVGKWEADHIVPVVEGGGECGLEGFRTLCMDCHHTASKELAGRLAQKRTAERLAVLQKPLVFGDVSQIEAVKFLKRRAKVSNPPPA